MSLVKPSSRATVLGSTGFGGSGDYNMTRKVTAKRVGDCAAPRQAPYAFYEGRKVALGI